MKIKYLLLATISGTIISLDQLTKMYVHTHFRQGEMRSVIPSLFDLTYVRNLGAAFGIFQSAAEGFRTPFFTLIPFIALVVIVAFLRTTRDDQRLTIFSLSLIFGGAMGNYIDRLRFQYVIDFLDFHWKEVYHWPAFNIADSAIVCGVLLLFFKMMLTKAQSQTA